MWASPAHKVTVTSHLLERRAAEIIAAFESEFVGQVRRTRDLPRLDALIAELAAIVDSLERDRAGDAQRSQLQRLQLEREAILREMLSAPAQRDEIHISEPGARVNIYAKLHRRAFHPDAEHLDLALLHEVIEGLERAKSDLQVRTPTSPARWMVENVEITSRLLALCRGQRSTLAESWRNMPAEQRRGDVLALLHDELAIATRQLDLVPLRLQRVLRLHHLASALRELASLVKDDEGLSAEDKKLVTEALDVAHRLDRELADLRAERTSMEDGRFTEALEQELRDLDEIHGREFPDLAAADANPRILGDLLERAASVGLHAADLYNATRSKRHDALAIQSRKRLELFEQHEKSLAERAAALRSVH